MSKPKRKRDHKFTPLPEKRYIVTDQCFWETNKPKDYNPLDPKRAPHAITLVDVESGSVTLLTSGSIIQVIEPKAWSRNTSIKPEWYERK